MRNFRNPHGKLKIFDELGQKLYELDREVDEDFFRDIETFSKKMGFEKRRGK